jgi:hypothetical protein
MAPWFSIPHWFPSSKHMDFPWKAEKATVTSTTSATGQKAMAGIILTVRLKSAWYLCWSPAS